MIKILWISQRRPLSQEHQALEEIFEDRVEITRIIEFYLSADDIRKRYKDGQYGSVVITEDKQDLVSHFLNIGVCPLWPEMIKVKDRDESHIEVNRRLLRFVGFKRIVGIKGADFVFA